MTSAKAQTSSIAITNTTLVNVKTSGISSLVAASGFSKVSASDISVQGMHMSGHDLYFDAK